MAAPPPLLWRRSCTLAPADLGGVCATAAGVRPSPVLADEVVNGDASHDCGAAKEAGGVEQHDV